MSLSAWNIHYNYVATVYYFQDKEIRRCFYLSVHLLEVLQLKLIRDVIHILLNVLNV